MSQRILVLGAGFGGIGMALRLQRAGVRSFTVLEKADTIGGTWRENVYPGCACDVASHLYSLSDAPNPDWTRYYPRQPEIRAYLEDVVASRGLAPHIRTGEGAEEAAWDAAARVWRVRTTAGRTLVADAVISATGPLSRPKLPDIPGLEDFEGACFHSARWDGAASLEGKRVGVVGAGASAIQIVPELAGVAARLAVFMRTAPWVVPRGDRAYRPWERWVFRNVPGARLLYRWWIYWVLESRVAGFLGQHWLLRIAERESLAHLAAQVPDPDLRDDLTPTYRLGCRRVLISDDYYPALLREDVELHRDAIEAATPRGLRLRGGREVPLDVLVLATGFDAFDLLSPLDFVGEGGRRLSARWREDPAAYLGTMVDGFPNLFFLLGPNTGLGHNSVVFMEECQMDWIMRCLGCLGRRGARVLRVRPAAQRAFVDEVTRKLAGTIWASGCRSWYRMEDGRIPTLWPGSTLDFWWRTRRVRAGDVELLP